MKCSSSPIYKKLELQQTPWPKMKTQIFGEIIGFVVTLDRRR